MPKTAQPKAFGTATRTIECSHAVVYTDRVLTEKAFGELHESLLLEARGSDIEKMALYTIVRPCTLVYRAGALNVQRSTDPQGKEVFALVDLNNTPLLYFQPLS